MTIYIMDWLSLALRFLHIITGIAWIGASFYFNWLENKLNRLNNRDGIAGHLWAVHGGGFYYLEKYKIYPDQLPSNLHWFKWEAYFTWLSGVSLLTVVYYFNASSFLLQSDSGLPSHAGITLSVLGLVGGWFFYDRLCKSFLVSKPEWFVGVMFITMMLAAYLYGQIFTPRATFIQIGAMIGTIMSANVFFVIIPVQKMLVKACEDKTPVSGELGYRGYVRSRHNNYFTLPVLFIMISNHYPMVYATEHNWLVMAALFVIAILIRHYFNLRGEGKPAVGIIWMVCVLTFIVFAALAPTPTSSIAKQEDGNVTAVSMVQVRSIIDKRCVSCHSASATDSLFRVAPAGFMLDTDQQIIQSKSLIYTRTIATHSMPFNNKTNMTEEERALLAQWLTQ